jgi:uncharacterized protein (TIGR00270 family)
MDECHICGSDAVIQGLVEKAKVWLCGDCTQYGSPIRQQRQSSPRSNTQKPRMEFIPDSEVVPEFGKVIKGAREEQGLSRSDLAQKLFIKENVLAGLEDGRFKPQKRTAEKLEKALKVNLIAKGEAEAKDQKDKLEDIKFESNRKRSKELTLADVIDIKVKDTN